MIRLKKHHKRSIFRSFTIPFPIRIMLIYLLVGLLWIVFSDSFLLFITSDANTLSYLQTRKGALYVAVTSILLFTLLQRNYLAVQKSQKDLEKSYDETLKGWARAMDLRDRETEGHTLRVTEMALRLASAMGLGETEQEHLRRGALLHDIGKIGVPDNILFKPGPLNDEEWEIMRKHPLYAHEFLADTAYLDQALDIPYCHHERWDGSGYPRGLQGEQIPLLARIFSIVDVWDALCSDRSYREAWPYEKVVMYIRAQSGTYFDPAIVEFFLKLVNEKAFDT